MATEDQLLGQVLTHYQTRHAQLQTTVSNGVMRQSEDLDDPEFFKYKE